MQHLGFLRGLPRVTDAPSSETQLLLRQRAERAPQPMSPRQFGTEATAALLFALAALALAVADHDGLDVGLAIALTIGLAAVQRVEFVVGSGYTVPTPLVFVPMLFALPAGIVPVCVAVAMVLDRMPDVLRGRRHGERLVVSVADAWFSLGPAIVFALAEPGAPVLGDWPVYAAAIGAQFGLDFAASAVRNRIGLGVPVRAHAREMPPIWLVDLLLSPIGLAGALLASATGEFAWLLLAPLAVLLRAFARERNARLDQALELSGTYRRIVLLLGDVVREDERVTGSHSQEVVSLAVTVADELRLGEDERQLVEFAALLHDVGKIALQQRVVTKEGPLDPGEWEAMRRHTIEGQRLLDRVGGSLRDVGAIVRSSHERWDGHGYPDGLAGEQIPIAARIVACADAFTAMVTERSYRPALSREEALAELAAGAGTQFDPTIAAATISVVERFNLPRRSAAARTETRAIALSRS